MSYHSRLQYLKPLLELNSLPFLRICRRLQFILGATYQGWQTEGLLLHSLAHWSKSIKPTETNSAISTQLTILKILTKR